MGRFALLALAFLIACLTGLAIADELEVSEPEEDVTTNTNGLDASFEAMQERRERAEAALEDEDEDALKAVIDELVELDGEGTSTKQSYLDLAVLHEKLSTIVDDEEESERLKLESRDYLEQAQEEAMKEAQFERAQKKARRIARREAKKAEEAKKAKENGGDGEKQKRRKGQQKGGANPGGGVPKTGGILLDGTFAIPALVAFVGLLGGVAFLATKLGEPVQKYQKPGQEKKAAKQAAKQAKKQK